ncbi:MAG: L-threonylcarbamoyladenylate synthase [bacterium]|nr:L-threonylcarbamoyladenylate synthase [bacterium]
MRIMKECNLSQVMIDLLDGQIIIYPTETTYGIGCDAYNQTAVDKIFAIKERLKNKPLLVLVDSVEKAKKYLVWNKNLEALANKYWPGPLTVIANANDEGKKLAQGVVSMEGKIAIRVTAHPTAKKLVEALGRPLVSTSANIGGDQEIYDPKILVETFSQHEPAPDLLVDFGVLPFCSPTTIVDVTGKEIKIIRQGELVIDL